MVPTVQLMRVNHRDTHIDITQQLFTLAQRLQDPLALLGGRFVMAATALARGEFVEAREHKDLQEAKALLEEFN